MADYQAPLQDMRFLLNEVFDAPAQWASLPGLQGSVDPETADAILEEAAKIATGTLAPLNRSGDEQGCQWDNGDVTVPEGFTEAYQTQAEGGWVGLGGDPAFGGMGMPKSLVAQVEEMNQSANMSFGLCAMLTAGACLAIHAHGSEELKQRYLPKMYDGTWTGAMDLTEPHAGTDLGIIRSKAEHLDDGAYRISGTKIFISWGEHGMAENIIHLVLAKLPGAPAGPKGISLFLVPKFLVNDDGSLGERNAFSCGSLEKKMGIKGCPTCVMNFDGARGWLVGEPHKGLMAMFTMMNYERLGVGIQGLGTAEMSYQSALQYAQERLQSRSPNGAQEKDKVADPILVHPDVRRMLLKMKASTEGSRAFITYVAQWLDQSKFAEDPQQKEVADAMVALLTPVAKAFLTDRSLDTCVLGQQVFGGHGYIREWGQEQLVRDSRIAQIYEGTNGIQAMDLMGRKIVANKGRYFEVFAGEVADFITTHQQDPALAEFLPILAASLERLADVTEHVIEAAGNNPAEIGAAAVDYLDLFGLTAQAYLWARMVQAAAPKAEGDSSGFYSAKLKTARFFYQRQLPQSLSLAEAIRNGAGCMMDVAVGEF